ncbi:MAG TPA: beta-N-acetylhexosaminidase [Bauldia sp.]|nr:beta-N-acetylhexosaminidase [Bauldia sp.]
MAVKAFVSGCAGAALSADETVFFAVEQPLGLILFKRNCDSPEQVRALVAAFRDAVGRPDAPVLIDQEGGRVRRLRPPRWPDYPPARTFGDIAVADPERATRAAWLHGRLIAADLHELGITMDCAPVLDVIAPGASDAIGDRSFGADPSLVTRLGRAVADGLIAGGVAPIAKHIPGQGRAAVDSHYVLPVVEADLATLARTDFTPFAALADLPAAMTSHTVFSAIDPMNPATTSRNLIRDIIRERIGFDGLLFSDDVSMNALAGDHRERGKAIFDAGCDIVLHCSGRMDDMRAIADVSPLLAGKTRERVSRVLATIGTPQPFDRQAAREEYLALTAGAWVGA